MDFTYSRICSKNELHDWLNYEKKLYFKNNVEAILKSFAGSETSEIWKFQKTLRKCEYYLNTGSKFLYILYKIKLNYIQKKTHLFILPNVCGRGLKIMHLGSILTNGKCRIGENCSLHINTAFVAQGVRSECPKLGNDIVVGVGASVLGGVEIANGIAIGANALVCKSFVEENIAIAGNPAKKVSNNGKLKWNKF